MTVDEMMSRMSEAEFRHWMAYAAIEPFGPDRGDVGSAIVAATLATCHGARNAKPSDFLPKFDRQRAAGVTDPAAQKAFFEAYTRLVGGEVKRGVQPVNAGR